MIKLTEKLFYENAYLKECRSKIVDILEENGRIKVVLDKTIFYPEGGGQPSDTGTIDDLKVSYVYEDNGIIYHCMEDRPKNKNVICKVDFKKRFDYMQQHSGEHLLSGAIFTLFNGNNRGFHLGKDYVTIDIDIEHMDQRMVKRIENLVNEYICRNSTIETHMVSKSESKKFPLRKPVKNGLKNIRIVQVPNMDCCACCGIHVSMTGEIGILKILKVERYKKMTRIYFKCGSRALEDFQEEHRIIMDLSRDFSVDTCHIEDSINSERNEIKDLLVENKHMRQVLAREEAKNIMENNSSNIILKGYDRKKFDQIKLIASIISKEESKKCILILYSTLDNRVLFANNLNVEINCGKLFKDNIKDFDGKGGGNVHQAQGAFSVKDDVIKFSNFLYSSVVSTVS
nr:alanine--tRNA ligase-related protein [Clostridium luticellarii]